MSGYVIVIPARHASERLPGKALADIHGKPMIEHVWRAARASAATQVVVATDDERIRAAVEGFGAQCVLTSPAHASGSDRIAECAQVMGWDPAQSIVNLQGDEPEMPPACLDQVAALLEDVAGAAVATLYRRIETAAEVADPNAVKVVFNGAGQALYFSRAAIPHARDQASGEAAFHAGQGWYRHLGLYAYRLSSLRAFTQATPSPLERAERLEQLRFLEIGLRIQVAEACAPIPPGIDTPRDLEAARQRMI